MSNDFIQEGLDSLKSFLSEHGSDSAIDGADISELEAQLDRYEMYPQLITTSLIESCVKEADKLVDTYDIRYQESLKVYKISEFMIEDYKAIHQAVGIVCLLISVFVYLLSYWSSFKLTWYHPLTIVIASFLCSAVSLLDMTAGKSLAFIISYASTAVCILGWRSCFKAETWTEVVLLYINTMVMWKIRGYVSLANEYYMSLVSGARTVEKIRAAYDVLHIRVKEVKKEVSKVMVLPSATDCQHDQGTH